MGRRLLRTGRRPDGFRIEDLSERHERSYFVCLEDWSPDMVAVADQKERWYEQHRDRGLRVKLALDEHDRPVGMIQYLPIEWSPAEGDDLYMILCIWVHGSRHGVGYSQGRGIGSALLAAAENDARSLGANGIAAWGLHLPVWMKASWFRRHGYLTADRLGVRELVWKPFRDDAGPPRWLRPQPPPVGEADRVDVVAFHNGWCPAANQVYDRARRAADQLGPDIQFVTIDTTDRATAKRHGRTDEVLVDGRPLQRGAPPSYSTIRRKIERRARRRSKRPT